MSAEPVQSSLSAHVDDQESTVTDFQTDVSSRPPLPGVNFQKKALPKKQKLQKSHFERFKPFDGPTRSEECIKRSIAFFSTCENFDDYV